jgi:hypothetical protein
MVILSPSDEGSVRQRRHRMMVGVDAVDRFEAVGDSGDVFVGDVEEG